MTGFVRFCRLVTRPAAWKRVPACLPALVAFGGVCGGGNYNFDTLRSLAPAVRDVDALEMPSIVGRWGTPDTTVWEFRRSADRIPSYNLVVEDYEDVESGTAAVSDSSVARRAVTRTAFDARIGRLGSELVVELRLSISRDSSVVPALDGYWPFFQPLHVVFGLNVRNDTLELRMTNGDSTVAWLRRRCCVTPYRRGSPRDSTDLLFTGRSEQVRQAYRCLVRHGAFLYGDSVSFLRIVVPLPTVIPNGVGVNRDDLASGRDPT